jgi:hypothetical protein
LQLTNEIFARWCPSTLKFPMLASFVFTRPPLGHDGL